MTTTTLRSHETPRAARRSLDDLAALDVDTLGGLYARGSVPALDALDGDPTGRMLAIRGLDREPVASRLRQLATAPFFPWGGKSFASEGSARGLGVNRVHLGGKHKLFPFVTTVASSVVDGAPCIRLDYDLPENPWAIRHIHDEVREVDDGLLLGPAMWRRGPSAAEHAFLLWFALDLHTQAPPFGWG